MNKSALLYIIRELSETIDDALLPQTTVSSLGLKLALEMVPNFREAMELGDGLSKQELFANNLVKLLSSEFDYILTPGALSQDCIRLKIGKCPFRPVKSRSLCSIMTGISAGLAFVTFGYCKVVVVQGPDRAPKPCHIDLYIEPSDEALSKTGVEYTKDNIVLMKERDDKFIEGQRIANRKLMLGLFSSIALSLRKQLPTKTLVQNFMESLSCGIKHIVGGRDIKNLTSFDC